MMGRYLSRLLGVALLLWGGGAWGTTLVVTENTTPQNATADDHDTGLWADAHNWIFDSSTNINDTSFTVARFNSNAERTAYLKPDFVASIPASQTITSATLYLNMSNRASGEALTQDLYRLLVASAETQFTWDDRLTSTAWNTAGGLGSGTDIASSSTDSVAFGTDPSSATYYAFDVTADVAAMYAGTYTNHGWLLVHASGTTQSIEWISKSGTDGRRQELVVVYEAAGGSTTIPITLQNLQKGYGPQRSQTLGGLLQ